MEGVYGIDTGEQIEFARECCAPTWGEMAHSNRVHEIACAENGAEGFGRAEADFLFCFIVQKRPSKIIQIGAGVATSVILQGARMAGYAPEIVCIEPHPSEYLRHLASQQQIQLVVARAQEAEENVLTGMNSGDLFFVDSTHTVKPGSEVNRIVRSLTTLTHGLLCSFSRHQFSVRLSIEPDGHVVLLE
jgi:hypothetical protein